MILWIVLAFAPPASAAVFNLTPPKSCPTQAENASFQSAQTGLESLRMPSNLMSAAHTITLIDENGNNLDTCSSTTVSDTGTLMTAGHCVDACLTALTTTTAGLTEIEPKRLAESKCKIKVDGEISPLQILATNTCRFQKDLPVGAESHLCHSLDYALLKIDPKVLKSSTCLKVADRAAPVKTDVVSMGFSERTLRDALNPDTKESMGGLSVSAGKVIPFQAECDPIIGPTKKDLYYKGSDKFGQPQRNENLRRHIDEGDLVQTYDAEFMNAGSGGALIDQGSNEILGVASFFIENSKYVECRGSTFFSTTAGMFKEIRKGNPTLDIDQALRCEQNKIHP